MVEFVVQNQMCDACHRQAAQDYWKAVVQVRQKVHLLFVIKNYMHMYTVGNIHVIMYPFFVFACFRHPTRRHSSILNN